MDTIGGEIQRILNYKTYSVERKRDALLEMDADIYCNLGIDSNKGEKEAAKVKSRKIYKAIKEIEWALGVSFLATMDLK